MARNAAQPPGDPALAIALHRRLHARPKFRGIEHRLPDHLEHLAFQEVRRHLGVPAALDELRLVFELTDAPVALVRRLVRDTLHSRDQLLDDDLLLVEQHLADDDRLVDHGARNTVCREFVERRWISPRSQPVRG